MITRKIYCVIDRRLITFILFLGENYGVGVTYRAANVAIC